MTYPLVPCSFRGRGEGAPARSLSRKDMHHSASRRIPRHLRLIVQTAKHVQRDDKNVNSRWKAKHRNHIWMCCANRPQLEGTYTVSHVKMNRRPAILGANPAICTAQETPPLCPRPHQSGGVRGSAGHKTALNAIPFRGLPSCVRCNAYTSSSLWMRAQAQSLTACILELDSTYGIGNIQNSKQAVQ